MTESRRTTLSDAYQDAQALLKALASRHAVGTSSVTLKTSAQGKFMPELTIAAGTPEDEINAMISQAVAGYRRLLAAEQAPDFNALVAEGAK